MSARGILTILAVTSVMGGGSAPPQAQGAARDAASPKPAPAKPAPAAKPAAAAAKPAAAARPAAAPAAAAATEPTLIGQFGSWGAYTAAPNGKKVCFALAKPASSKTT